MPICLAEFLTIWIALVTNLLCLLTYSSILWFPVNWLLDPKAWSDSYSIVWKNYYIHGFVCCYQKVYNSGCLVIWVAINIYCLESQRWTVLKRAKAFTLWSLLSQVNRSGTSRSILPNSHDSDVAIVEQSQDEPTQLHAAHWNLENVTPLSLYSFTHIFNYLFRKKCLLHSFRYVNFMPHPQTIDNFLVGWW